MSLGTKPEGLKPGGPERAGFKQEIVKMSAARSLMGREKIGAIYDILLRVREDAIPGSVAEVGVYRGGSAQLLAAVLPEKTLYLFDTFTGIPNSGPEDSHAVGVFGDTSEEAVRALPGLENAIFCTGIFPETTEKINASSPNASETFAVALFDGDQYQSAVDFLEYFYPRMVPGGLMIFDDYDQPDCPGVKKAIDGFLAEKPDAFTQPCKHVGLIVKSSSIKSSSTGSISTEGDPAQRPFRIALISTWGRRCGLATYAEWLAKELLDAGHEVFVLDERQEAEDLRDDAPAVHYVACWQRPGLGGDLEKNLAAIAPDVCVFSHDWHEIQAETVRRLAVFCAAQGFPLVIGWHNLVGIRNAAQEVREVSVHVVYHPDAPAFLRGVGVQAPVVYIPHGCGAPVQPAPETPRKAPRSRVATFGLMYPSKATENVVQAVRLAQDFLGREVTLDIYSSFNAWTRGDHDRQLGVVKSWIRSLGMQDAVNIWSGFPSKACLLRTLAGADLTALLYRDIPFRLSSSGALPEACGASRPVVVSQIEHFASVGKVKSAAIYTGDTLDAGAKIAHLLGNDAAYARACARSRDAALSWTYRDAARMYLDLFHTLVPRPRRSRLVLPLPMPETGSDREGYGAQGPCYDAASDTSMASPGDDAPAPVRSLRQKQPF